ncbi:hypothetical protein [Staphylococcus delphini]|uniref:hypothetical protein n=1 Tax=Staphylococcus delphini TaxID=53344 RepID=UPI001F2C9AC3|nr:hypothetical protein [Staphylococcus delphini]
MDVDDEEVSEVSMKGANDKKEALCDKQNVNTSLKLYLKVLSIVPENMEFKYAMPNILRTFF